MNVIHKWDKVLAIGCNHGHLANPKAIEAVLRFNREFKPKHRIHLGDNYDLTAFRTGAKGNADESEPVQYDLKHGRDFVTKFEPTVFCMGNHENRAVTLSRHHNTIIATAADAVLIRMLEPMRRCRAKVIPYTVHKQGWHYLGGYAWGHGHFYGENYLRDTAESFGNTVVAHAHRSGAAKGRRSDNPTCYGVGTLSDIPNMDYASGKRSTLSWSSAMVFGYVHGDKAQLCLWEWPQNTNEYLIP